MTEISKTESAETDFVEEEIFSHMADDVEHGTRAVEATLFASEKPMTVADIKLYVGEDVDIREALAALQRDYEHRGIV